LGQLLSRPRRNLVLARVLSLSVPVECSSYPHRGTTKTSRTLTYCFPIFEQAQLTILARMQVFACDERGEPLTCSQDSCHSSYLSIRTRHCRDCGICQPGFDHHCSFMDNCVSTSSTFKPFLQFIFYAILLLSVALVPLAPLQLRAFREVIAITWETKEMSEGWWKRWYSWAGGPVWRYAGGLVLGYIRYPTFAQDRPFLVPGHRVETFVKNGITYAYDVSNWPSLATPTLSTLTIVAFATLIDAIGLGSASLCVSKSSENETYAFSVFSLTSATRNLSQHQERSIVSSSRTSTSVSSSTTRIDHLSLKFSQIRRSTETVDPSTGNERRRSYSFSRTRCAAV